MKYKDKSEVEMAIQAAELAKEIPNEPIRAFTIGAIVAITDKFLPEEYKKRLLEVLRMTQIEQWIREEGREEGEKEGRKKTAAAALKKGFDAEIVAEITGLSKEEVLDIKKNQW